MSDISRDAIPGWVLTSHVLQRVDERAFTLADVRDALDHPERCFIQSGERLGREERQRGRIKVIVNPMTRVVITVLFRDRSQWLRHSALAGAA